MLWQIDADADDLLEQRPIRKLIVDEPCGAISSPRTVGAYRYVKNTSTSYCCC